ncbi:MAG: hypothetical protein D6767_03360 [Candidatus Hydrogenedentota bacterium]|nr:MAG: hypothetical protein D6767_03360 [Candidatus Hydrogenedentota bacterium]
MQTIKVMEEHCCMDRGVRYRLLLSDPITREFVESLPNVSNVFWLEKNNLGLYRFVLEGRITVSGIPEKTETNVLYALHETEKAEQALEKVFPGFLQAKP